ncbi:MAG: dephospho-CoA kinase [Treponema sp.]|nr:dephospho-CoA kinase [Treponema sp.]
MIIGLTGAYCAGKNHVASILEKRGFPVLDADKLGHEVLENEKEAVFARFGYDLKKPDNSLNRRLLGQRVFGKPEELAALEAIIHPKVNNLVKEWLASQSGHCVINAALLHKSAIFEKLEKIILVTAPFLTRLLRALKRDRLSLQEALKRFASQKNIYARYLSINANPFYAETYRVENPGFRKLERSIEKIIERMS